MPKAYIERVKQTWHALRVFSSPQIREQNKESKWTNNITETTEERAKATNIGINLLRMSNWKPNSMADGGESDEQSAADNSNSHRQRCEDLKLVVGGHRVVARDHVLVEQRHRREHHQRREGMEEVQRPQSVAHSQLRRYRLQAVDDPKAPERGHAVAHPPGCFVVEAVGEAEEEAGEGAEDQEAGGHEPARLGAAAEGGEDRGKELEGEHRAGGEVVGEVGGALVRLADDLLYRGYAIAGFMV
ncbi:unnamed protein product [Musa acuminata subsp. burmannicoides]